MIQVQKKNRNVNLSPVERYFQYAKDGNYYVNISKSRPSRSSLQNRYYWGVVIKILARELGYTKEEMHEALVLKFLGTEEKIDVITKEKYTVLKSTTRLNTVEMEEYLSKIRQWGDEFGYYIPLPNECEGMY